ncbi:MAG: RICIN domain-containing protein, partial [Planctomycetota bacterium]
VDGIRYSWGLSGLNDRLNQEWVVTTTSAGTTFKNVETQQYLAADGLWDVSVEGGRTSAAYWTIVNNSDGSISLRNNFNGRYLDADGGGSVGLSVEIRHDDGWFVTEVDL